MLAHNATAMLSITYSARLGPMGEGTGLYRSHPFATPNMTGGAGEQGSPEGNERGNGIAMVGNGRRLGDDTMDTTNTTSGNQSSSVPSFSVMVVSQFEALGARRLLPCVDLPAAKAVFVLERLQVCIYQVGGIGSACTLCIVCVQCVYGTLQTCAYTMHAQCVCVKRTLTCPLKHLLTSFIQFQNLLVYKNKHTGTCMGNSPLQHPTPHHPP